jgi:predicted O-methyltransferase YrrM
MFRNVFHLIRNKCNWFDYRWQLNDLQALQGLQAFGLGYVPWSGASLTPAAMRLVANDIVINRRRNLLELGAGVSTILLSKLAREYGCQLTSVDHDTTWIEVVREILKRSDLQDCVNFVHAPLATFPGNSIQWYSTKSLDTCRSFQIDMLLIDGPPAHSPGISDSRSFALPWFSSQLSSNHSIFLDDIFREGEKRCIAEWEKQFGYTFDCRREFGGLGYAYKGDSFSII